MTTEFRRSVRGLATLVFLGVWSGCEDNRLDMRNVERLIADRYVDEGGAAVVGVDCPEVVPTRAGATFECTVRLAGGGERTVIVEQQGGTRLSWRPAR